MKVETIQLIRIALGTLNSEWNMGTPNRTEEYCPDTKQKNTVRILKSLHLRRLEEDKFLCSED